MAAQTKKKLYYGWIIVIAGFLLNFVNTGFLMYTFSLFAVPVTADLGVTRTQIMVASSIWTLGCAVLSPFVGDQMEKGRVKLMVLLGALFMGVGLLGMNIVNNLFMFYLCYGLAGVGCACAGPAIHTALPSIWFDKRRGLAVGIVNCGAGVGAIISPKIAMYMIENFSWRAGYTVFGVLSVIILVPLALWVIRHKPQDMGLLPDGISQAEYDAMPKQSRPAAAGLTRNEAFKTPTFWMMALALFAVGFAQLGVMQNQASHLGAIEFDMAMAAGALSIIGFMTTISKFVYGWVVDKLGYKMGVLLGYLPLVASIIMLATAQTGYSSTYMYIYAILFGLGLGCWTPIITVAIGKDLGAKYFSSIWGILFTFRTAGDILGVPLLSGMAEAMGGYRIPLLIAAGLVVLSGVLILLLHKPAAYQQMLGESDLKAKPATAK